MTAFDVSPDGSQVVYSSCAVPLQPWGEHGPSITRETDAEGNEIVVIEHGGRDGGPSYPSNYELARINIDGTESERLTDSGSYNNFPAWSPDGTQIAFVSKSGLYVLAADGAPVQPREVQAVVSVQQPRLPAELEAVALHPPAWSPDGAHLAFVGWGLPTQPTGPVAARFGIYTVGADGADLRRLTDTVSEPSWSPDGQRIAFAKPDGDDVALYTMSADGSDPKRVTTITGWHPQYGEPDPARALIENVAWSPDGSKILYTCGGICVVSVDGKAINDTPLRGNIAAWSPDGSRIAVAEVLWSGGTFVDVRSMAPDGSDMRSLPTPGATVTTIGRAPPSGPESGPCTAGFVVAAPAENPGLVQDCETLFEVLTALFGEQIDRSLRGSPIETWPGIRVSGSPPRVTALTLLGHGLDGTIPVELGALTHLQSLALSFNKITGPIPPKLGELARLAHLDLSFNQITGPIPAELAKLTRLLNLDLSWNEFSGPIPAELGQLADLELLSLEGNPLTGCIPAALQSVPDHDLSSLGLPDCG